MSDVDSESLGLSDLDTRIENPAGDRSDPDPPEFLAEKKTPPRFDLATCVASLALIVSIAGVVYQRVQSHQMDRQEDLAIHSMLIERNATLLEMIVEYPNLRPYFYENQTSSDASADANRVATMAELWTDLFEQVLIQSEFLPENMVPTWKEYAKSMYSSSPAIRAYFDESHDWYVPELSELWLPLKPSKVEVEE